MCTLQKLRGQCERVSIMTPFAHHNSSYPNTHPICNLMFHRNIAPATATGPISHSRRKSKASQRLHFRGCFQSYACYGPGLRPMEIYLKDGNVKHRFFISFLSGTIIGNDLQSKIWFEASIIELLSNLCCHDLNIAWAHFELIGE